MKYAILDIANELRNIPITIKGYVLVSLPYNLAATILPMGTDRKKGPKKHIP
jgi:hypothetical protein